VDGSIIGQLVASALREGRGAALPALGVAPTGETQATDFSLLLEGLAVITDGAAGPVAPDPELPEPALQPGAFALLTPAEPTPELASAARPESASGTTLPTAAWTGRPLPILADPMQPSRSPMAVHDADSGSRGSPTAAERTPSGVIAVPLAELRHKAMTPPGRSFEVMLNAQQRSTTSEVLAPTLERADLLGLADAAKPTLAGPSATAPGQPGVVQLQLPAPLQHPGWNRALGQQLQWLVNQRLQQAEIKINPPELGPLEIKISMQQDQANVSFLTHHGQVREAVEQAIPRLREMLAEQGMSLGDVDVSERSFAEREKASEDTARWAPRGAGLGQGPGTDELAAEARPLVLSLLDVFA